MNLELGITWVILVNIENKVIIRIKGITFQALYKHKASFASCLQLFFSFSSLLLLFEASGSPLFSVFLDLPSCIQP